MSYEKLNLDFKVSYPVYRTKEKMRKEIEGQVKDYLAKGGKIQQIPEGHSVDFGVNDNDFRKILRTKKII